MKKKYIIISVIVTVLAAAAIWFFFLRTKPQKFKEYQVKNADITVKILATGTVQPENRLQIKSPLSGRAESILVREGQKVRKGEILAWVSSTERAVLLDSARALGSDEVKKWEDIYKATPVIAPLGGTIILRSIEPGQTFTTADAIFVMADRLTVQAQVDETDLAQIHLDQPAEITMDAYLNQPLAAKVNQIAYEAKTVNNVTTYTVYVLPNEKIDFLRSGMTANVTFFGETKSDIPVVSNEFIKYEAGKPTVQVRVEGEDRPQKRELKLGITDGKITEILSGLKPGDTVLQAQTVESDKSKGGISFSTGRGRKR